MIYYALSQDCPVKPFSEDVMACSLTIDEVCKLVGRIGGEDVARKINSGELTFLLGIAPSTLSPPTRILGNKFSFRPAVSSSKAGAMLVCYEDQTLLINAKTWNVIHCLSQANGEPVSVDEIKKAAANFEPRQIVSEFNARIRRFGDDVQPLIFFHKGQGYSIDMARIN